MSIEIIVNNKAIQAKKGETILNALNRNGIRVPTLCHMSEFTATGSCRLCVVEIEGRNELVPACSQPVEETIRLYTHSPRVINARKTIVELLLSNHPDDCLYCERNQHCELQNLAVELNVRERRFFGRKKNPSMDTSSPAIIKDDAKCILCGRCIRVCDERIQASAIDFSKRGINTKVDTIMGKGLNYSSCISCGQCILVCPSGALSAKSSLTPVLDAINDKNTKVMLQLAPSVGFSLAEEMGFKAGKDITPLIISGLRAAGIDFIFDLAWAGDLYITETCKNIKNKPPHIISTCPSIIKYIEQFYPETLPFLNTVKSPQQIMGAIIKNHVSKEKGLDVNGVFVVSVGSCTSAKAEATRLDNMSKGIPDVDAVLTSNELARLLKLSGIDLHNTDEDRFDAPFHVSSSSGSLYHCPGGLTEGIYRQLSSLEKGNSPGKLKFKELRNMKAEKEVEFQLNNKTVSVKVVSGIQNVKKYLEQIANGQFRADILDASACILGCMSGGGQPITDFYEEHSRFLLRSLYKADDNAASKSARQNPFVNDFSEKLELKEFETVKKNIHHKFSAS